ncbi:MAG TPA: HAD family hydrolase [Casimicrobiaceae bacterium]|nr:HAD family hydrolase [Casimicrobiaceae bacterium]
MPPDVLTLFDLDNTLVPYDTEALWVDFLVGEGVFDPTEVTQKSRELTERYNRGEAAAIEFSEFYLSLMAPHARALLDALRERFIVDRVRSRITPAARLLVDRHKHAGDCIVLTTAVFRYLAEPQAAELGIDNVIATEPEMSDGRFTGRVLGITNSREGKVERLREWLAQRGERLDRFREIFVYADSINDLPLLSHATHPVAVNADALLSATARHSGWPILTLG